MLKIKIMKKKDLLMMLVAGLVITSAFCLSSCKKNQTESSADAVPNVVTTVFYDRDGSHECPYCHVALPPGTLDHYHNFGVDKWGNVGEFAVDACQTIPGNIEPDCVYSGMLLGDPATIAAYMSAHPEWSYEDAYDMTQPRFHRHLITFQLPSNFHNDAHVGGGVYYWP